MIQKVATSIEKRQTGRGLSIRKRPPSERITSVTPEHSASKQVRKSKKRKQLKILSKRDIFDGVNQ